MPAISRQSAKIFASNAPVGQVTAFRTTESTPQTTKAPDQIQNENYLQGWLNADGSGNVLPYAEDMNGLFYTLSYNTAYLYEKGIPEYSSTQTYYLNSFCQYSGKIYRCKGDSVINIAPTNTNYWDALPSSSYTATTVGAGTTNYGTVYAGTDATGTQFQFKTIIGGSNVTISETSDSITIASSGGGGSASFVANSPLSYSNGVLSIPAATSSQAGYLTAADWTSFNSKLSSTIFSSNNTWTGTNTVRDLIPSANSTYSLGSTTYAWDALYSNYILSNSNDHLAIGSTIDNNRILINYLTSGGDYGVFPDMVSGTSSYLGNSVYKWNYGYIDSLYSANINLTGALTVGIPSDLTANKRITIKGYDGNTEGTLTDWASLGWFNTGVFGFRPVTSNTGTIGNASYFWNKGYFTNLCATGIYSKYDPNTQLSSVGLFYNTHLIEVTPAVQWGYMGQKSANEIGLFPLVSNVYLGSSSNFWDHAYVTNVHFSTDNIIAEDPNSTGLYIGWKNSNNIGRYVRFAEDAVHPIGVSVVGMTLGTPYDKWDTVYTNNINLNGTSYNKIPVIPTGTIGAAYYNILGTNSNGNVGSSSAYFSGGDLYLSSAVRVRAEGTYTGEMYWYNTDANVSAIFQLTGSCVRAWNTNYNGAIDLGNQYIRWGTVWYTTLNPPSDIRLKENIEPLESGLKIVNDLDIKSFTFKNSPDHIEYGIIAQEVVEKYPELISLPKEDNGTYGTYLHNFIFVSLRAIQELSAEVEILKQQLKELKK